jgi:hypothetical protein
MAQDLAERTPLSRLNADLLRFPTRSSVLGESTPWSAASTCATPRLTSAHLHTPSGRSLHLRPNLGELLLLPRRQVTVARPFSGRRCMLLAGCMAAGRWASPRPIREDRLPRAWAPIQAGPCWFRPDPACYIFFLRNIILFIRSVNVLVELNLK